MVTNNKVTYCRNLEYETDLAGARPPYSRVTKLHGRKVKSYELDVACSKLGLQNSRLQKVHEYLRKIRTISVN